MCLALSLLACQDDVSVTESASTVVPMPSTSAGAGAVSEPMPGASRGTLPRAGSDAASGERPPTAGAVADAGALGASGSRAPAIDVCDRTCLIGVLSSYLDALAARDPARVVVGSALQFTENGVVLPFGSGLWSSATAVRTATRLDFADPVARQVGSQLLVEEDTAPVLLQVRLKVEQRAITEIESVVMRTSDGFGFDPTGMTPDPIFGQQVPLAQRMAREAMRATTEPYLDALESGDFSGTHFDEKVIRRENGTQTADYQGFEQRATSAPSGRAIVRRYLAFDEEYGLVFGMFPFMASANAMVASEVFKVADHKIMMINVVLTTMPTRAWPIEPMDE